MSYRKLWGTALFIFAAFCILFMQPVQGQPGAEIQSISPNSGPVNSRVTLFTTAQGLLCELHDYSGIDTVDYQLGTTDANGRLDFNVPDGLKAGQSYTVECYLVFESLISIGTVQFTVTAVTNFVSLQQPEVYFVNTRPQFQSIGTFNRSSARSVGQRFEIDVQVTNPQNEVLQLAVTSGNITDLLNYVNSLGVFFDIVASPTSFTLSPDTLGISSPCTLPPAMAIGARGRVLPNPPRPNRLRAAPSLNAHIIDQIVPNAEFTIIDGPVCADRIEWWYVRADNGNQGWTAEGSGSQYYTESYPDIEVQFSVPSIYASSQTALVYYAVDPEIPKNHVHSYTSISRYGAKAEVETTGGQVSLLMWRTLPSGGYFGLTSASGYSASNWLGHNSAPTQASYAARVIGGGNLSQYILYGSFALSYCPPGEC